MSRPQQLVLRSLDVIDALGVQWVEAARPVRFRVAAPGELDEVLRLRCRTIVEEGWADADAFPDGLERDEYDDRAVHIVAVDGTRLAGTARLVLPDASRPLPTERAFALTKPVPKGIVDLGRMVVSAGYRDGSEHRVFAGLLGQAWLDIRSRGFEGILGSASAAVIARYEQMGVRVAALGAAQQHWGEQRFPVIFDVAATAAAETAGAGDQN